MRCDGCGSMDEGFRHPCTGCKRAFCSGCIRQDRASKKDVCQDCEDKTAPVDLQVVNMEMDATGVQIHWRQTTTKTWGEVHIYQKQGGWYLDAQGESEAVVTAVLLGVRKFLGRTG